MDLRGGENELSQGLSLSPMDNLTNSDSNDPSNPTLNVEEEERVDELDALIDHDYDLQPVDEDDSSNRKENDDLMSTFKNLNMDDSSESKLFDQSIFSNQTQEDVLNIHGSTSNNSTTTSALDDVLRAPNLFLPQESSSNFTMAKGFPSDDSFFNMDGQTSSTLSAMAPAFPGSSGQTFLGSNSAINHVAYSPSSMGKEFLSNKIDVAGQNINHGGTNFPPPVRTFVPPINNNEDLIVSNLPDLYAKFWELSFKLFFNVCSPYTSCHECLTIIEDIIVLVHKWGQLRSPTLVVALDVVVQRAMYELSDKMCKIRSAEDLSVNDRTGFRSDDGMENIEDCVSVMSHLALPLCWNVQNDFNLNFLAEGTHSLGSKMQTLNRQLQELVAWTSIVGQTKAPITFVDGATTSITDFSGVVRVDSPRSQATLEMLDHTMLSLLVENGSNQSISPEFMGNIETTLHHIISRHMGTAVDIHKCGAYALSTIFSEAGPELDYVVLTPQALQNVTNWKRFDDQTPATSRGNVMKQCERIVELDLLSDNAIKHVKACIKDFVSAIGELLGAVRSFTSNRQNFPPEFLQQNYQYLMMLNGSIEEDTDHLRLAGERFLEKFEAVKLNRVRTYPSLPVIISKIELLQDSIDKDDKEKNGFIRKTAKAIEKPIRDAGFAQVRCMTTRARFVHINFVAYDNRMRINIPCTVILENELPLQGTLLIREYMRYDRSGKIRGFFSIIKKFVKSHKICDVSTGFLSMFAWYMMGLHVLLRFNYIPNIHQHGLSFDENPYCPEYMAFASAKINSVHIMELLDRFFRYYVEDFDTFLRVVSIQGHGEVLRKSDWPKNPVLWRISIEDPFAPLHKKNCYDLGSTLSRPGQLTTFKAMRRAVYGIRSIVAMGMDSTRVNMKKFFSRAELIHLARRSDYVGAAIIPPRQWNRKVVNPVLLSLKSLQEPLSADKLQAIAQLNLEDSVAMISPREQTPRSVMGTNNMYSGVQPGFQVMNSNVSSNNLGFKPKEDLNIDSRYSSMPNSGRSQYGDFTSNPLPNNASANNQQQQRYGGFADNNQFNTGHQQQFNQQQQQRSNASNVYSQATFQNNNGMYNNNNNRQVMSAATTQQHQLNNNFNNNRYGNAANQQSDYYQNSSNYPPQASAAGQQNFFQNNPPAASRPGVPGFPAPNIVNGQVLNPYVPPPAENKVKKPMVPPIPLQGISSKPMTQINNGVDGNWSQRSGWTNSEAPYSDRYNSSMASSRSDKSSVPPGFPQGYGKGKSGMDNNNMSPVVTGRSSDSDGIYTVSGSNNDPYSSRGHPGGNFFNNQMNSGQSMVNGGFDQQQMTTYDNNNAGMHGNGYNSARNNRGGYNNQNYREYSNNTHGPANSYQSMNNNSWEAPDSTRSWNGPNNKGYDFNKADGTGSHAFNLNQGGGGGGNSLWMGSNPNTARSLPSGAVEYGSSDDFNSPSNYSSRKNLPGLDNNNNARFY